MAVVRISLGFPGARMSVPALGSPAVPRVGRTEWSSGVVHAHPAVRGAGPLRRAAR